VFDVISSSGTQYAGHMGPTAMYFVTHCQAVHQHDCCTSDHTKKMQNRERVT